VSNIVRLLQLPPAARDALQDGKITEGHARAILALKDESAAQATLLELIYKNGWSVRQAEQYVTTIKAGAKSKKTVAEKLATETADTRKLAKQLGTKVSLKRTAKGGRLEIHFKDESQLDNLVEKIAKKT
jgi:ParB family chromosome partitioning protein